MNDFYHVKQFGGFFKIFWEIFKNYRIISKIQNTKIIGRGAATPNIPTAAKPPEVSGKALAKPLVLYKKASLHSLFRACREREKSAQQFESILLKTNYRQTGAVPLETLAKKY